MLKVIFIQLNFSRKYSGKDADIDSHQAQLHLHSWETFDAHIVWIQEDTSQGCPIRSIMLWQHSTAQHMLRQQV